MQGEAVYHQYYHVRRAQWRLLSQQVRMLLQDKRRAMQAGSDVEGLLNVAIAVWLYTCHMWLYTCHMYW